MTRRLRMSGFANDAKGPSFQEISEASYGHNCPQHCPGNLLSRDSPLGAPLTIREAARLIGCSDWTIRQRYLPQGLPHLRSGPTGKLIFYRDQVIAWILNQQEKGGTY